MISQKEQVNIQNFLSTHIEKKMVTIISKENPDSGRKLPAGSGWRALDSCRRSWVLAPDQTDTQGLKTTEENVLLLL